MQLICILISIEHWCYSIVIYFIELLDLKPKKQKTVIVCAKQEEVEEITLAAKTKGVNVISAHQGIPQIHCAGNLTLFLCVLMQEQ